MSDIFSIGFRYLPSTATFAPPNGDTKTTNENKKGKKWSFVQNFVFSPLGCNAIFVIVACITFGLRSLPSSATFAPPMGDTKTTGTALNAK